MDERCAAFNITCDDEHRRSSRHQNVSPENNTNTGSPRTVNVTGIINNYFVENDRRKSSLPPILETSSLSNFESDHYFSKDYYDDHEHYDDEYYDTSLSRDWSSVSSMRRRSTGLTSLTVNPPNASRQTGDDDSSIDNNAPHNDSAYPGAPLTFHKFVFEMTHSRAFNRIMLLVILINALVIALEMEMPKDQKSAEIFASLNYIFLAFYTMEFILKLFSDKVLYWMSAYNLFDFAILAISFVDFLFEITQIGHSNDLLSGLRSLRAFRALKIVSFIQGVQVIAGALATTLKQLVVDVILLLLLLMFVFGVMGFYFFGYESMSDEVTEQWGHLTSAFLTLFTVVTADRWSKFIDTLVAGGNSVGISRSFIICFLLIGHFITANLFIAVIITNIQSSANDFKSRVTKDRDILVRKRKKEYWYRCHKEVKRMIQRANLDGRSNFQKLATDYYLAIQKRDFIVMSDLKTNLIWVDTLQKEICRQLKSNKRIVLLNREIVGELGPVCNQSEVDKRRMSISQNRRYIVKHKIGGLQLLAPGSRASR